MLIITLVFISTYSPSTLRDYFN